MKNFIWKVCEDCAGFGKLTLKGTVVMIKCESCDGTGKVKRPDFSSFKKELEEFKNV